MLIAMVSGKAAPGLTTSTWALSMAWPGPVLVVDADPAGGDMAAGLLLGRMQAGHSVLSWSAAARRMSADEAAMMIAQHVVSLPEEPHVWVMPGFQTAAQASAMDPGSWERLAGALRREGGNGQRDVLVDTGRLGDGSCWPVIRAADRVVLVCRRSGRSINAAYNTAAVLRGELGDLDSVGVLVVDEGGSYEPKSIARELNVPLVGVLASDRVAAAVLSDGAVSGLLGFRRSRLFKSARRVANDMVSSARQRGSMGAAR
jgi:MinD-like ATPase involved in chromosome partitioning or flagellar assembly